MYSAGKQLVIGVHCTVLVRCGAVSKLLASQTGCNYTYRILQAALESSQSYLKLNGKEQTERGFSGCCLLLRCSLRAIVGGFALPVSIINQIRNNNANTDYAKPVGWRTALVPTPFRMK